MPKTARLDAWAEVTWYNCASGPEALEGVRRQLQAAASDWRQCVVRLRRETVDALDSHCSAQTQAGRVRRVRLSLPFLTPRAALGAARRPAAWNQGRRGGDPAAFQLQTAALSSSALATCAVTNLPDMAPAAPGSGVAVGRAGLCVFNGCKVFVHDAADPRQEFVTLTTACLDAWWVEDAASRCLALVEAGGGVSVWRLSSEPRLERVWQCSINAAGAVGLV